MAFVGHLVLFPMIEEFCNYVTSVTSLV